MPSWKRLRSEGWTRAAGAQYTSGIYFVAMIDGNGRWSLGFAHENWKFTQGQAFPPTLTFDGQQPFNIHGVTVADKVVRVLMPTNSALIAQFRKATACGAVAAAAGYRDQVVDTALGREPSVRIRYADMTTLQLGSCRPLPRPPLTSCGPAQPGHSSCSSLRWRGFAGPSLAAAGSAAHMQR